MIEFLDESSVESDLLILVLSNLCDLFLKELQITQNLDVLEEIPPLISQLLEIAEKRHSFTLFAEIYLFKAKIEMIKLNFDPAQKLLTKAQIIARKYNLSRLAINISLYE